MDFELGREQKDIAAAAREFALGEMAEHVLEWDQEAGTPLKLRHSVLELGFLGLTIPEAMGGAGLGLLEEFLVIEEFSAVSAGLARGVLEPGWGAEFLTPMEYAGLAEKVIDGDLVLGFTFPAPAANRCQDLLDEWTGFALADAELLLVPGNRGREEGLFLVPVDTDGVRLERLSSKLGLRSWPGARLSFQGLNTKPLDFVSSRNGIVRAEAAGAVRAAATTLGLVRGVCEATLLYVRNRHLFGRSLADFEATKLKFFGFWRDMQAARLLALRAAVDWDRGHGAHLTALAALVHSLRIAQEITDEAVQLHGGYGYFEEMLIAMRYRDAKMMEMMFNPLPQALERLWEQLVSIRSWKS